MTLKILGSSQELLLCVQTYFHMPFFQKVSELEITRLRPAVENAELCCDAVEILAEGCNFLFHLHSDSLAYESTFCQIKLQFLSYKVCFCSIQNKNVVFSTLYN